ncbi:MAG: hypothetical protein WC450_00825 [Candidatus Omnitrophota bacterium]|jgi:hypothetical protein
MTEVVILKDEFVKAYAQGIGIEGAEKLIRETSQAIGLSDKQEYTKNEAIQICEALKKKDGFIKILACSLLARIYIK